MVHRRTAQCLMNAMFILDVEFVLRLLTIHQRHTNTEKTIGIYRCTWDFVSVFLCDQISTSCPKKFPSLFVSVKISLKYFTAKICP